MKFLLPYKAFYYLFFLFAIYTFTPKVFGQVVINEVQAANTTFKYDPSFYNYSGWIELYNPGATFKKIGGYYLTDSRSDTTKWIIPAAVAVMSKGYVLFWCDNKDAGLHTNFSIDTDGECLYLYSDSLKLVDSIRVPMQYSNLSYGRINNGATWGYLLTPTPSASNSSNGVIGLLPKPVFSFPSGKYSSSFDLTLTTSSSIFQIRYTTDGSEPTFQSLLYSSPIPISKTTIIKAKTFTDFSIPSETVTNTYFINEHDFTLPVVSISMNPAFLWDNTIGIYVQGTNGIDANCSKGVKKNFNQDWGRYCVVEYFNKDGVAQFKKDFETKVYGGCSRTYFPQKSLAFYARNEFGKGHLEYPLFASKNIDKFDAFVLRNSGNDFNFAQFRDPLMQTIIKDRYDVDWQASQPATVYLNGAYWGIMNIREKLNEHYIEHNAKIDKDSIDFIEKSWNDVIKGSNDDYITFLITILYYMNIWEDATYYYIDDKIDVNNFIQYFISEIYYCNTDWPGNNIKYWQPKKEGGKWRWILFDTDFGFALPGFKTSATHKTFDFVTDSISQEWPNPQWSTLLFRTLIKNPKFRERFIQTFEASLNSVFKPQRVTNIIDSMSSLYASEMVYHKAKWGGNITGWNRHVDSLKLFAYQRNTFMIDHLRDFFKLTQPLNNIEVSVYPANAGSILFNGIKFPEKDTFQVYQLLPYNVDVSPATGYRFKQWRIKKGNDTEFTSNSFAFVDTAKTDISYIAEFEAKIPFNNLYINEIAAKNTSIKDNYGNSDDWFELYNANADSVDITGLLLTDNFKWKNKFQIRSNGTQNTKIPPYGYSVFWADEEEHQGNDHTSFKLSGTGERIGFYQVVGTDTLMIDTMSYSMQTSATSYIRFPDGTNNLFFTNTITPKSTNIKSIIDEVTPLLQDDSKLIVYPNPVQSFINIKLSNITDNVSYSIYNNQGQKILTGRIINQQINCSSLKPGIYLLKITDNARNLNCGFIKE